MIRTLRSLETTDFLIAICLLLILFAGCGQSGPVTGKINGQVMMKGQPLTQGAVYFYAPATGYSTGTELAADGTFELADPLPTGSYRVSILPPAPAENGPDTRPEPASVQIPKQYLSETSTPLEVMVKEGENSFPLAIE